MRRIMRERGAAGAIGILEVHGHTAKTVAHAMWFGDPWTGDWEWRIEPEDAATRERLDMCYEENYEALHAIEFDAFGCRPAAGWTTFEGLFGALDIALRAYGYSVGAVE
jgi:hypothetical protein